MITAICTPLRNTSTGVIWVGSAKLKDGTVIHVESKDPEHDLCRALRDEGLTGYITFLDHTTGQPGLKGSIKWFAGKRATEGDKTPPKIVKHYPKAS